VPRGTSRRSALLTLGRERRTALSRTIGTAVLRELDRMIAPWFSRGMRDHAAVDVFHASLRGSRGESHAAS
jgi:hypothetical protein